MGVCYIEWGGGREHLKQRQEQVSESGGKLGELHVTWCCKGTGEWDRAE